MNGLKKFFKAIPKGSTTYNDIYEGPLRNPQNGEVEYDPTYWKNDVAYQFERTHKLTLDKPCVKIKIPFKKLNVEPIQ